MDAGDDVDPIRVRQRSGPRTVLLERRAEAHDNEDGAGNERDRLEEALDPAVGEDVPVVEHDRSSGWDAQEVVEPALQRSRRAWHHRAVHDDLNGDAKSRDILRHMVKQTIHEGLKHGGLDKRVVAYNVNAPLALIWRDCQEAFKN